MNEKKSHRIMVIIICLVLILAISIVFCIYFIDKDKNQENNTSSEMNSSVVGDVKSSSLVDSIVESSSVIVEEALDNPIDFKKLKKTNKDIYAWIEINDTKINSPILQHKTDKAFYLTHDSKGKYSVNGSIYTEDINNKDFNDLNTLVYGHNTSSGIIFGDLHKFRDKDFFDKTKSFTIYTKTEKLEYNVFAAYIWNNEHIMYAYNYENPIEYKAYLDKILANDDKNANIRKDTILTSDSNIVTLSTCEKLIGGDGRLLVQAVLVDRTPLKIVD